MKITIEKSQGEFRVPSEDGYEDVAYYTDDKADAIDTAKKVFGDDITIVFRSVAEFVGGKYEKIRPKKLKEDITKYGYCKECERPLSPYQIAHKIKICTDCEEPPTSIRAKKKLKESEAHKEEEKGYEAGYDGKPKSSCPYLKGSIEYKAWIEGYENAKEDKTTEFGKGKLKESREEDGFNYNAKIGRGGSEFIAGSKVTIKGIKGTFTVDKIVKGGAIMVKGSNEIFQPSDVKLLKETHLDKALAIISEAKEEKKYIITRTKRVNMNPDKTYVSKPGTLVELIDYYKGTLETGQSYEKEKGNKKINCNPKNIGALISNLTAASNNAASNGYSGCSYDYEEAD